MKTIITIGRQFGSGGKEIGIRVAKELGIPFYDKELLQEAAKKSGLCEKIFENFDERPKSLLYSIAMDSYMFALPGSGVGDSLEHQVYLATFNTIRHIADQGPCVIIGRCADYALALFHFGYSDFAPRKWSIAIPRSMSRTKLKIDTLAIQPYYVQENLYGLGKTVGNFNGVALPVYDRERTICDCFKYRSRLDNELFAKALNAYVNDTSKDLKNLSEYAKQLRVHKKVTELMEVLLNG